MTRYKNISTTYSEPTTLSRLLIIDTLHWIPKCNSNRPRKQMNANEKATPHSTHIFLRLDKSAMQQTRLPFSRAIQTLEAFSFYRRARSICSLVVQRKHEPNAPTDSSSRTTSVSSQEIPQMKVG